MASRPGTRPPRKIFHKIGEVCDLTKTEPYVLRYWESEFPFLAPEKNRAGQRIYSDEDIDTVLAIKRLLYQEGYTTAGARRRLEKEREDGLTSAAVTAPDEPQAAPEPKTSSAETAAGTAAATAADAAYRIALREVRDGLRAIRASLAGTSANEGGAAKAAPSPASAAREGRPKRLRR